MATALRARPASLRRRIDRFLLGSPSFFPLLVAIALCVELAGDEGGFRGVTFFPVTLLLLGTLLVALFALPVPRPPRSVWVAVVLLALYAVWSYLSITWAADKGLAWDGANRTVMYAVIFALFAMWPIRGAPALFLIGGYGLAIAGIGLVELLRAEHAHVSIQYFYEGRLSEPTGYANANVELWFSAFWACIVLAARREVPVPLRGLALGASGLVSCLAVMGQSRGWLFLLPVAVILFVAMVPGRGRNIVALATVGVGMALAVPPILEVLDAFRPFNPPGSTYGRAVDSTLLLSGALLVVGTIAAAIDRRVTLADAAARKVSIGVLCLFIAGCLAAVTVVSIDRGSPVHLTTTAWSKFKRGGTDPITLKQRYRLTLNTYRYNYWQVAWREFERRPLTGIGVDNFGRDYAREGVSIQTPRYPHSVEIRTLAQTGLIGVVLLLGSIVAALCAAAMALRRGRGLLGPAAGVGAMAFIYWMLTGSLDWFWEFPGLGAPAFAMFGAAVALGAATRPEKGWAPALPRPLVLATGVALVVAITVGITMPWMAELQVRKAEATAASDTDGALAHLRTAAKLNPISSVPQRTAGTIEARRGHYGAAAAVLRASFKRAPADSFSLAQLSAIASVEMRDRDAKRLAVEARAAAPLNEVIKEVESRVRKGDVVSPQQVIQWGVKDVNVRTGPE